MATEEAPQDKVYGPTGTNPGGQWFKRTDTSLERDCCTALVCGIFCCQISLLMFLCCPYEQEVELYYLDPVTQKKVRNTGAILGSATKDGEPVTEEELADIQTRFNPYKKTSPDDAVAYPVPQPSIER